MSSSCDCCEDGICPHVNWITLDRWRGSKVIPNNLRDLQLNNESIWGMLDLDKYKDSNWQWRVVVLGTGYIPDLTKLCLQQNRRQVMEWISPLSEQLSTVFFKLELGNIRWPDAPLAVHGDLIGGDFTLTLKAFSWSETTTVLPWDATAQEVQDALQALPNAARAGTIEVTGVPLAFDEHMTVACIAPLDFMSLTATTNFIGIPPTVISLTTQGGGPSINETQMLAPSWPADGGTYTISLTAQGNTQTTNAIQHDALANTVRLHLISRINCDDPPSGNAMVVDAFIGVHWRRHYITFVNALTLQDIQPLTTTSSLTNAPTLIITTPPNSDVYAFRNEYEPLNVGTIWNGYLRKGYGNADNRELHGVQIAVTENLGGIIGTVEVDLQPCGHGVIQAQTCSPPYFGQFGVKGLGLYNSWARADFNELTGTIGVSSTQPYEFAIQIRCMSCRHSSEFNLWGVHENNLLLGYQIADRNQSDLYEPSKGFSCGIPGVCRDWTTREDNVPFVHREKFSPDGYDGHLINDKFFADGGFLARKPTCSPDVVLLGAGYWLEQNFSMQFNETKCIDGRLVRQCSNKPKKQYQVEHPTSAIERLKTIYGTDFSYWGSWIDPESIHLPTIRCTFSDYDLTDIKVLFLGGFPVGACPQTEILIPSIGPGMLTEEGDDFFTSGDSWWKTMDKDFESTTLDPLMKWLDLGGKVLVLDGGCYPNKLLAYLGLSTIVEQPTIYGEYAGQTLPTPTPSTLNGSLYFNPVWGGELPDWVTQFEPPFEALYVEPQPHPFTSNVLPGLVPDFTFEGSSIAGQPLGTGGVTQGLINISQKFSYDGDRKPVGGLRSYTTCIPLVVPGPNAIVLGRVVGQIAVDPWSAGIAYVTGDVDYPGVVVEHWNCNFKLRFTDGVTTEETTELPFNATALQVQNALEALILIGPGLSVVGGPLPGSIDITFSTSLTGVFDITQLEVVSANDNLMIETITQGGVGIDEVQRISLKVGPSRVVISMVNELMEPDQWGTNWSEANASHVPGGVMSQREDNQVSLVFPTVLGCSEVFTLSYGKTGYHWGLGLSNIASAKFLQNLLEYRNDY